MQRIDHGQTDLVFAAFNAVRNPTADVQRGGYHRGGTVFGERGAGGCRVHDGPHQYVHKPVHRCVAGNQRADGKVLCGGAGSGGLGDRSYFDHAGIIKRNSHGLRGALFFQGSFGAYGYAE